MNELNECAGKILIIDDNPAIHEDFQKILAPAQIESSLSQAESLFLGNTTEEEQPRHYDLDFAYQGMRGVEMARSASENEDPFDIAFVDMRMPPGWDGVETIEALWEVDPQLQTVICTAYSDYTLDEIQKRLRQTEQLLILKKPFDNVEVVQITANLAGKRRMIRELNRQIQDLQAQLDGQATESAGHSDRD